MTTTPTPNPTPNPTPTPTPTGGGATTGGFSTWGTGTNRRSTSSSTPTATPQATTPTTPALRSPELRAAAFAKSLIGTSTKDLGSKTDNFSYCLGTVADAFTNNPSLHNGRPSSIGRHDYAQQFIDDVKSSKNNTQGAPGVGDIALYSGGDYGHVAVGIGNGYVVSGDISFDSNGQPHYSRNGEYHRIPYDKLATIFGKKYEGYTEGTSRFGGRDNNVNTPWVGSPAGSSTSGGVTRATTRVVPTTRVKSDSQVASGTVGSTAAPATSETRPSSTSLGSQFSSAISGFTGAISNFFGGPTSSTGTSGGVQPSTSSTPTTSNSPALGSMRSPSPFTSTFGKTSSLEAASAGGQSPLEQPVGKI